MPSKKTPPPNVARLTPDEQISYLFHQYEGFADWRIGVDEKLQKVDALDAKVDALVADFAQLRNDQREAGLGVREILLFLKGQQTPGLERPGITADFTNLRQQVALLESTHAALHQAQQARIDELETKDKVRTAWVAGVAAAFAVFGGGAAIYFHEFLHKLYLMVSATPLK